MWWPRHLGQMIAVQSLHRLSQPFMAIVLLIPHVLVIHNLPILIQREAHEAIHNLANRHQLWVIFLLELEDELPRVVLHDLRCQGLRAAHDHRDAYVAISFDT